MARQPSIPRLAKAASGNYEIRWTESGRSRRESTGTSDLSEAKTAFAQWMFDHGKTAGIPTVETVVASYLRERCQPEGREALAALRLFHHLGDKQIDALTPPVIARYVKDRPVATGTVRREIGVLVAAVNHAIAQRRVMPGVAPRIELPPAGEARSLTLSRDEVMQILEFTKPCAGERMSRLHRFVWIATETAMRRRSIETLRWAQVDIDRQMILPERGSGKIKRRVPVPISDALYYILRRAHSEREGDGLLVLDHSNEIYQAWRSAMEKLSAETGNEIFAEATPHDLRRTWATHAARAGVSIFEIAGVLGNSVQVASKHYTPHQPEYLRAAINFRESQGGS